jgi:hypothetical protein
LCVLKIPGQFRPSASLCQEERFKNSGVFEVGKTTSKQYDNAEKESSQRAEKTARWLAVNRFLKFLVSKMTGRYKYNTPPAAGQVGQIKQYDGIRRGGYFLGLIAIGILQMIFSLGGKELTIYQYAIENGCINGWAFPNDVEAFRKLAGYISGYIMQYPACPASTSIEGKGTLERAVEDYNVNAIGENPVCRMCADHVLK